MPSADEGYRGYIIHSFTTYLWAINLPNMARVFNRCVEEQMLWPTPSARFHCAAGTSYCDTHSPHSSLHPSCHDMPDLCVADAHARKTGRGATLRARLADFMARVCVCGCMGCMHGSLPDESALGRLESSSVCQDYPGKPSSQTTVVPTPPGHGKSCALTICGIHLISPRDIDSRFVKSTLTCLCRPSAMRALPATRRHDRCINLMFAMCHVLGRRPR